MLAWITPLRWPTTSQERALANARQAAVECSRQRLERVEVELYLAELIEASAPEVVRQAR